MRCAPITLSPYGAPAQGSPELARWAARGIVFEHVLAQSSWTKSSMASLLTSRWPRSHGVIDPNDGLGDAARTLAEVLREAGWRTYAVQSNGWLEEAFGFEQGFERYLFPRGGGSEAERSRSWPHADNVYREAERLIDAQDPEQPFFLYLHFMDVHEYAAPPDVARPRAGAEGEYAAAIAWVDEVLARLRERLERRGLLSHSVLILASDHGEAFGENGAFGHARNVFTPVLRVPLVLRLPFAITPTRIADPGAQSRPGADAARPRGPARRARTSRANRCCRCSPPRAHPIDPRMRRSERCSTPTRGSRNR